MNCNHNWKAYRVNITVALGNEMVNYFKIRDVKAIRDMYEKIDKQYLHIARLSCGVATGII